MVVVWWTGTKSISLKSIPHKSLKKPLFSKNLQLKLFSAPEILLSKYIKILSSHINFKLLTITSSS